MTNSPSGKTPLGAYLHMQSAEIGRINNLWVFEEVCVCVLTWITGYGRAECIGEASTTCCVGRDSMTVCVCVCVCVCQTSICTETLRQITQVCVNARGGKVERTNMVEPE